MSSNRFEAGDGLSFDGRSHGNSKVSSVGSESECLSQGIIPSPPPHSPTPYSGRRGGLMFSALVSSPDQAVWVRALAGVIVLCSWATEDTTLTVPLSTQVYKWVPANLILEVTLRWTSIPSREE